MFQNNAAPALVLMTLCMWMLKVLLLHNDSLALRLLAMWLELWSGVSWPTLTMCILHMPAHVRARVHV